MMDAVQEDRRSGGLVGLNIRRARQSRGVSVTDLARAAGLGRATLTEIESGKGNPTLETLDALAAVLRVPTVDLLTAETGAVPVRVGADDGLVVQRENVRFRLVQRIERHRLVTELWEASVSPGQRHLAGPMPAGTLAHAYVASGSVTLGPVETPVSLGTREFAVYRCDLRHVFESAEDSVVMLCLTYTPASADQALSTDVGRSPG